MMDEALREPWHSLHRQREAASFGVWVFLGSEAMFFGGALMVYAMYRLQFPAAFAAAARETNIWYGSVNTAVLLTSSLSMAVASEAAEAGLRRLMLWGLAITAVLGTAFLVIKGFEYREDIGKHLIPGPHFELKQSAAQIFWAFYWLLTGVHALHLTIGIVVVSVLACQAWREVEIASKSCFRRGRVVLAPGGYRLDLSLSADLPAGPGNVSGLKEHEPATAAAIWRSTIPVWLALLALLSLTLMLAYVPMGSFNTPAAVGIACLKTALVVVFFMHLRRPVPLLRLTGMATLLWLFFMFALTLADILER